jgi:hypothetical protein
MSGGMQRLTDNGILSRFLEEATKETMESFPSTRGTPAVQHARGSSSMTFWFHELQVLIESLWFNINFGPGYTDWPLGCSMGLIAGDGAFSALRLRCLASHTVAAANLVAAGGRPTTWALPFTRTCRSFNLWMGLWWAISFISHST